jgi:FkbM family methyltransferase
VSWRGQEISQIRNLRKSTREALRFPRRHLNYSVAKVPTIRRGTEYGGWWFSPERDLSGGLIVSAGVGEDISFDIAIASAFGATVHLVDPTPRAVCHFEAVLSRLGEPAQADFQPGGVQPPTAYELSNVKREQLTLHPYALWNADGQLDFFAPQNPDHVSHTVGNWRNVEQRDVLRVEGRRLSTLLQNVDLNELVLLKLDIEGSEIEVVEDLVNTGILPHQLLIEFDQLASPNQAFRERARRSFHQLRLTGYRLIMREGLNFSFIRN